MSNWNWNVWKTWLKPTPRTVATREISRRRRWEFDTLEERTVPAVVDLTTQGAFDTAEGAIFRQVDAQPTGTGVIDSFVRLQSAGAKAAVQQGFNTDARPLQFDENNSNQFTRSIRLNDLPQVNIGGTLYRELLLDINQKASQPYLSLDELRIFVGDAGNLSDYNTTLNTLAGLNSVFDLDATEDNWVKLDCRLNQGSGKGDMLALIPESGFGGATGDQYVYLYSKFGVNFMPNAGFEEWAVSRSAMTPTCSTITGTVLDNATGLGVADVTLFLDANRNGLLDGDEVYTTTDSNGTYSFSGLASGFGDLSNYLVGLIIPEDATADVAAQFVWLGDLGCKLMNGIDFSIDFEDGPPDS